MLIFFRAKIFVLIVALLFAASAACASAQTTPGLPTETGDFAMPPEIEAGSAILIERGSGRALFAIEPDLRRPIASTTKIMTALLTLEHCGMEESVTASANASGVAGTSIYLGVGETLTVREMLLGLLLRSGNDAAVALAEHVSGSVSDFSRLMNLRALELGADAHFVNPHGLDAREHEATARAMAIIACEALSFPAFRALVTTKRAEIPWVDSLYDRVLTNKNKLLTRYEGATGIKTGFTKSAGRCLVFSARRNGMELVGVLLNAPKWFDDAAALLDWGFKNYRLSQKLYMGQTLGLIPVKNGIQRSVRVEAGYALCVPLSPGERPELILEWEKTLYAPIRRGQIVGRAALMQNGEEIASVPLVTGEDVPPKSLLGALKKLIRGFNPVG